MTNGLLLIGKEHLTPDKPVLRGTAQNPDVFFQARESVNKYYNACPDIVQADDESVYASYLAAVITCFNILDLKMLNGYHNFNGFRRGNCT
jgi:hypothetical protein